MSKSRIITETNGRDILIEHEDNLARLMLDKDFALGERVSGTVHGIGVDDNNRRYIEFKILPKHGGRPLLLRKYEESQKENRVELEAGLMFDCE